MLFIDADGADVHLRASCDKSQLRVTSLTCSFVDAIHEQWAHESV